MPELPEVETIKLVLQKKIVGKTIRNIEVLSPKSFIGDCSGLRGRKVLKIERKAKLLVVNLDKNSLLFHLKMTGQLIYEDGKRFIGGHPTDDMMGKMPNSHTRVIFSFSDGSHLYFNDQRRFGWIKIIQNSEFELKNLGPEPLEEEFTWQVLKDNLLKHKSQPVKVALMDQTVVSGVGNIYSNEACFNAKIDPRTKVGNLTDNQFKSLHQGVVKALRDGISHGGSTRAHFRDPEGHKGYFLDYAYVYGLDKHPCRVCKTEIKKVSLGGRGTYFCHKCQK
ncbi:bifunctional DNA-formamidopyrimidine glycosylase/DNA-(apurinic or apyrimidinic site) lyase [Candidatus Daviesbacteria bacterium]|nr:bifunctional DNA-formamidopyrimidine glycosylase/DNA-(apurinic or apyrimidinic site) lyase [Candidatus Daviesbacteria bacterium]